MRAHRLTGASGAPAALAPAPPQRIQRQRTAGWRMPENTVYVGRMTKFGNPFPVVVHGREAAVRLHREWLATEPELLAAVRSELRGRNLACWCPEGLACHADTLLAVANEEA